jgi:hypothetical protein
MMTNTERRAELSHLTNLYADGGSPTVMAYLDRYGDLLPESVANKICQEHATTLRELPDTELIWGGDIDHRGGFKSVYTVSLFSVLGY